MKVVLKTAEKEKPRYWQVPGSLVLLTSTITLRTSKYNASP